MPSWAILRVRPGRILSWIRSGQLGAIDTGSQPSKHRYVIMPWHVAEFCRRHAAGPAPRFARRTKRIPQVDYYSET
jgi:hypothetical protein